MKARVSVHGAALLVLALASSAGAQGDAPRSHTVDLTKAAVERVKAKYFSTDYIGGLEEADRQLKQFPKSRELAAWRVANLARVDRPKEAEAAANALVTANRDDPWGWFAKTFVASYASEAANDAEIQNLSLEAYRRDPGSPTVAWLRASALANDGAPAHALALVDTLASRGPLTQEMKTIRASALFNVASNGRKTDIARADSAFALYAAARESDPNDVTAYIFPASRMMNLGRNAEAYELTKHAVDLAPASLAAHQNLWRAISARKDRTQDERNEETLADVEQLLRLRGNEPTVLLTAAQQYDAHKLGDRARQLENRILAEHPASGSAEWVLVQRYRALAKDIHDSPSNDSSINSTYRRALWSYVDRPTHVSDRLLGDAYRELFQITDSTANADTVLRIVRGMVKYEGINPHIAYAGGAIRLAERGRDFKEAEQLTRDGLKAGRAKIDEQKSFYETIGDYAAAVDWMSAIMYDALGVVYVHEGKRDDAQREFVHARDLDPKSVNALYHLGQLAETRGQLGAAEQLYIKGSLLSAIATNPSRESLRRLYKARNGSLDGYDAYLAGIADADRATRRAEIAKTRAASPHLLKPFHLRTLDGKPFSLDSLQGKAAVINNWGMWCGPCVAEMPEFQKLAAKFANDSSVRVLTIDNDPNTDDLQAWLQKKGYTFTTLIDDGYLPSADVHEYPTTWFLDQSGHVVFTKTGWSEKLVEEFTWRVEMIQGAKLKP